MLTKALILGCVAVTTPLYVISSPGPQDPTDGAPCHTDGTARERAVTPEVATELDEIARLERELRAAAARVDRAEATAARLQRQLDQSLDLLEATHDRDEDRHNCTPSRSMLTHWQWMQGNGFEDHAQSVLERYVTGLGNNVRRLNSVAWSLMTDDATMGQYDAVALALARRMQAAGGELSHATTDTVALAHFLNGHVDEAIALQHRAIARGGNSDDYRRRLRMYEAARDQAGRREQLAGAAGGTRPGVTAAAAADEGLDG